MGLLRGFRGAPSSAWFKLTHYPSFTMLGAGNAAFVRLIGAGSLLIKQTSPKTPCRCGLPMRSALRVISASHSMQEKICTS
jgi:hypothetical protein